jgi:DNA-binding PadR family transcriptional regulator
MSKGRLPAITHLQFLVLGSLLTGEQPGRELRRLLGRYGIRRSAPAFYQLMSRLEDAGLVEGAYTQKIVQGQLIKERRYEVTPAGAREWTAARDFFAEVSGLGGKAWSRA